MYCAVHCAGYMIHDCYAVYMLRNQCELRLFMEIFTRFVWRVLARAPRDDNLYDDGLDDGGWVDDEI